MNKVSSVTYALNGVAAFLGLPMFLRTAGAVLVASGYAGRGIERVTWFVALLILGTLLILLKKPSAYVVGYAIATVAYLVTAVADGSIRSASLVVWLLPVIVLFIVVGAVFAKPRTAE